MGNKRGKRQIIPPSNRRAPARVLSLAAAQEQIRATLAERGAMFIDDLAAAIGTKRNRPNFQAALKNDPLLLIYSAKSSDRANEQTAYFFAPALENPELALRAPPEFMPPPTKRLATLELEIFEAIAWNNDALDLVEFCATRAAQIDDAAAVVERRKAVIYINRERVKATGRGGAVLRARYVKARSDKISDFLRVREQIKRLLERAPDDRRRNEDAFPWDAVDKLERDEIEIPPPAFPLEDFDPDALPDFPAEDPEDLRFYNPKYDDDPESPYRRAGGYLVERRDKTIALIVGANQYALRNVIQNEK